MDQGRVGVDELWDYTVSEAPKACSEPLLSITLPRGKLRPPGRREKLADYHTISISSRRIPGSMFLPLPFAAFPILGASLLIETKTVSLSRKLRRCCYSAFSLRKEV